MRVRFDAQKGHDEDLGIVWVPERLAVSDVDV